MSQAIAIRSETAINIQELQSIGQIFAKSGFFSDARDAGQAIVKIMAGQELGFQPIASMTGVHIVKGKVSLSANLMAAAIKRSGKYNFKVRELTAEVCRVEFFEAGESIGVSEFTMREAKAAKLDQDWDKESKQWKDKATWKNFPKNMLYARAMSNGAKWFCPDIFGGPVYTPDELDAPVGEDALVITEPAKPAPLRAVPAAQATVEAEAVDAEAMIDDATMSAILNLWPDYGFKKDGQVQPLAPWLKANKGVNALKDLSAEVGAKMLHWLQSRALAAQQAAAQEAAAGQAMPSIEAEIEEIKTRLFAAGVTAEQYETEFAAEGGDADLEAWVQTLKAWADRYEAKAAAA